MIYRLRQLLQHKASQYWSTAISSCNGDSKSLWTKINALLKPPTPASSASLSADDFAAYFTDKVNSIRSATAGAPPPVIHTRTDADRLSTFKPVTDDEIRRLLSAVPAKQCALDPAPTWLIKQLADVISPVICHLCNMSCCTTVMPSANRTEASHRPPSSQETNTWRV